MNSFKVRLPLRYKLMIVLSSLPILCLALYLLMAVDLFKKDKVAYVFDSSVTYSRSIAAQTRLEMETLFTALRPICESFDFDKKEFSPVAKMLFDKQIHIRAIVFFQKDGSGHYSQLGTLVRDPQKDRVFVNDQATINRLRDSAILQPSSVTQLEAFPRSVGVSFHAGESSDPHQSIVVALYSSEDLLSNFESEGLYNTYLMKKDGKITLGPNTTMILNDVAAKLNSPLPEGTAEMKGRDHEDYLVSFAATGIGDLSVVSYVNKKKALRAVEVLIIKSLTFFIALISSTVIISVIASGRLTATLTELFEATEKIAHGDFNVSVESRSNDEIGGLAHSFTWMAKEVSRLMSETAQKARMENELATVKTVQETLFPPASSEFGPLSIVGHYEPASECGGDWWSYSKVEDRVFLWIGDATGHGAPAALITSAARSAAAVIETFTDVSPGWALQVMNHAIHATSKGKINMTFFLGCLDLKSGVLTYSSASHDPPYLMRKSEGQDHLRKKDLVPLMEVNGPRLGERPDTSYSEKEIQLQPGDMIFFYTDGVMDIQNPKLEKWGERTFLKTLVASVNSEATLQEKLLQMRRVAMAYRNGADLIDDVTMFLVEYNPANEAKVAA